MRETPRIAAIHDLSGFGRCSLTVILPVLSAMGVQGCPIPTAFLSTHTGGFEGYTALDLTEQMEGTICHWEGLGLKFEGVYTGFLSSQAQIGLCIRAIQGLKAPGGLAVVDPVMGDHGRRYATYTDQMCRAMAGLCRHADVITPNLTEAAFLLGKDWSALTGDGAEGLALAKALGGLLGCSVALTGVSAGDGLLGAACYDRDRDRGDLAMAPRVDGEYHGTGDLFAAVLSGAMVKGAPLAEGARQAARFVSDCAARTRAQDYPRREGVDFEPLLGRLWAEKDCK